MNTNPKTFIAVKWEDLKTSSDLTSFMLDQNEGTSFGIKFQQNYITRQELADILERLKDLDTPSQDEEDFDPKLTNELAQVAKVIQAKGIQIIIL